MKNRQRRLMAIELTLTPKQVVLLWLRNARQAGTFEDCGGRQPPNRGVIANAIDEAVRNSMQGQDESLIEQAVVQGRQEADLLYMLVGNANVAVRESRAQREFEYVLLLEYLSAVLGARKMERELEYLRRVCLIFIASVLILEGALKGISSDCFDGQAVLFRDSAVKLTEQLQMTIDFTASFNESAEKVGARPIDLDQIRNSLHASQRADQLLGQPSTCTDA